jgi:hypothetical protein
VVAVVGKSSEVFAPGSPPRKYPKRNLQSLKTDARLHQESSRDKPKTPARSGFSRHLNATVSRTSMKLLAQGVSPGDVIAASITWFTNKGQTIQVTSTITKT